MKSKIYVVLFAALLTLLITGCAPKDETAAIAGIWKTPPVQGFSEGLIYEFKEGGEVSASFDGVLYVGGTYEVKGSKLTLKNHPVPQLRTSGDFSYTIIDYKTETEYQFEVTETTLTLTGTAGAAAWERASVAVPTPTPTPTPTPEPVETPTPPPELESVEVLYGGAALFFKDEFSLPAGEANTHDKFTVVFTPAEAEAEVTIVSEDEEIFIVELLGGLPNNAFAVTGISKGNAQLIVTAVTADGDEIVKRITVRVTE